MPRPDIAVTGIEETAFAKINLALHVRARRDDGYHALESVFAFADGGDVLWAAPAETLSLTIDGPFADGLDAGGDNLVMRAAQALRAEAGVTQGAAMRLTKNLPVASGIGGGSADAAAALRMLMRLWDVELSSARLHAIALALGSDVPACVASRTLFVGGRGEHLDDVVIDGLGGAALLLVNPRAPLATGPVFAGWDRIDRGALEASSIAALAEARNDLQPPAVALVPAIADVLAVLGAQAGVTLHRMSGSGATCFALFDTIADRDGAAAAIGAAHPGWWTMAARIRNA